MVKPLTFKGDPKKPKKRKRAEATEGQDAHVDDDSKRQLKAAKAAADAADKDPAAAATEDDSWVLADVVSDVSGPVMFVLPSDPPCALACDPAGKVFAMPIENIIDGNPSTAEPHDVRQVWVANRIVGTEHFRFKGHHGKYLSCDKIGILSATSEAVSALESFTLLPTPDTPGTFQLQTLRDTFISVRDAKPSTSNNKPPEIRGDETSITFHTTLRVRMQARFKPRRKDGGGSGGGTAGREEKTHISRRELEEAAGRKLNDDEVRMLRRARREGNYREALLDIKVKSKHDKWG
ncbi:hypothetical protein VTJ49DRAFT_1374 [Mycothermus thermophilus]|uniref:Actin-crosslinking protein n=1 Tax=Humicola insolens TaxID=85995 RepID=A0ABR3VNM4_HUMIN